MTKKKRSTNRAVRDEFFLNLHMRVVNVQRRLLQQLLNESPELMGKFVARWKQQDSQSFVFSQDPKYEEWLKESEIVVEEDGEEFVFVRTRNLGDDIIKVK